MDLLQQLPVLAADTVILFRQRLSLLFLILQRLLHNKVSKYNTKYHTYLKCGLEQLLQSLHQWRGRSRQPDTE